MQKEIIRCQWCGDNPLYQKYHDEEWGKPIYADDVLFEYLVLESFQSGLSWITILRRREHFRLAFDNFKPQKIAQYSEEKVKELLQNKSIIRHQQKILATINNAQKFIEVQKEFGSFSKYIWHFSDNKIINNQPKSHKDIPSSSEFSDKVTKDLRQRDFKFIGSTTIYSYLQAIGIINNHISQCFAK